MNNKQELPTYDMLSILFANRNRAYGAYQLRREYPQTIGRALGYAFALIALFFAIPYISAKLPGKSMSADVSTIIFEPGPPPNINPDNPPPPPPPALSPPPPTRSTIAYVPPIVVKDNEVTDDPPAVETILEATAEVGAVSKKGDDDAPPSMDKNPAELALVEGPPASGDDNTYDIFGVNKPPSFPGGEGDLLKYLAKYIQYPPMARENNIQGVVVLRFVIGKNGNVRQITILKDIGGGCGKEAVRVVEAMPNWSPGEANGHAVNVRFTLPVRFELR